MTRSKRTISARGFGVTATIMKPAVSKAALRRNINQSSSTKLVLDDNDGSPAHLVAAAENLEDPGNISPDENDDAIEPQHPTFNASFNERKKSNKGRGKLQLSPKRIIPK